MRRLRPSNCGNARTHRHSNRCSARRSREAWLATGGTGVRKAKLHRKTAETEIRITLTIEGRGKYEVSTGIRFLDHMLALFTRHGGFDLELAALGDLDVDQHHTVEDVGIALGEAFDRALGNRRGILRAGYFVMPLDE